MNTFRKIIKSPLTEWHSHLFLELSSTQLEALCILLGIPKSGTKAQKIQRLIATVEVRVLLERYLKRCNSLQEAIYTLEHEYKASELKALCRQVGAFYSKLSNKYAIATSLMNWRNNCLQRGKEAYQQVKAEHAKKPKQLSLL